MTSAHVAAFPGKITIPLILAAYSHAGIDYDPRKFIIARSANGEVLGTQEVSWEWPDIPGSPVKFWVFVQHLEMLVPAPGVYGVGLYDRADDTVTDHVFPLPVVAVNSGT